MVARLAQEFWGSPGLGQGWVRESKSSGDPRKARNFSFQSYFTLNLNAVDSERIHTANLRTGGHWRQWPLMDLKGKWTNSWETDTTGQKPWGWFITA